MTNTKDTKPSPIEVWLTPSNPNDPYLTTYTCRIVRPDESTEDLDVTALSLRGAQREMTGYFIDQGYQPVGRWQSEVEGEDPMEASRTFKLA